MFKVMIVLALCWTTATAQPTVITTVPDNSTNFVTMGDLVYFTVGAALWRTDGTEAGTFQLGDRFNQGNLWEHALYARYLNGYAYFVNEGNTTLWRSDGTTSGTVLLRTSSEGNVRILGVTDNYLFFVASDAATGAEVYRTDGSVAGTILLRDINPGSASGFEGTIAGSVGNELLFAADNGTNGVELWKSDGTSGGTTLVKDIYPGSADGIAETSPYSFTNSYSFNGQFYFQGITPDEGAEPWVSDGTAAGTVLLRDVEEGTSSAGSIHYEISNNGFLYFVVESLASGPHNLWKSAGTPESTTWIQEISEQEPEQEYHSFLVYHDKVYFWARRAYFSDHLWVSDGTTAGTYTFYDIITIDGGINFFEVVNDYMLFTASAENIPYNLYRSDGTAEGTVEAADLKARYYGIYPRDFTRVGDLLFYGDHDGLMHSDGGFPVSEDDYYHMFEADGDTTYSMRTLWGVNTIGSDNFTGLNGKVIFTTYNNQFSPVDTDTKLWVYDPAIRPEPTATFTLVRSDSDKDVKRIIDGAEVRTGWYSTPINIRFDPVATPGSVVFRINGTPVRKETAAPYSLAGDVNGDYAAWEDANAGMYTLTATAYSGAGGTGTPGESLTVTFTIPCERDDEDCFYTGELLREQWNNVPGATVASIPLDRRADVRYNIGKFEARENIGDNYGARVRGFVLPPTTGDYTFWIASNDHSELWLSTDDQAGNKAKIASLTRATNPREWNKFPSQRSQPIRLIGGRKYYIEALHKEGVGTDHLSVGWQLPDGTMERPIPGNRLVPFVLGSSQSPTVTITHPVDGLTFPAPQDIRLEADAYDGDEGTITKVEFLLQDPNGGDNTLIFEDTEAPYYYIWEDVAAGHYTIVARATDTDGNRTVSDPVHITGNAGTGCTASGTITREYWSGVSGTSVSQIPVNSEPTSITELMILEGPSNVGTNYGSRIRGYICPPETGGYVFWISSNDHSELWLSADDDPANRRRIAYLDRATGPREWQRYASQSSGTLWLTEGQTYYIEVLHKQGIGTDHVAVGWMLPSGELERPIPGSRLSPFMPEGNFTARMANADMTAESKSFQEITIYPNPATIGDRELTIGGYEGVDEMFETQIRILNMTGNVVHSEKVRCGGDCESYLMKFDQQLVPGLYIVDMEAKGVRASKRLLVK